MYLYRVVSLKGFYRSHILASCLMEAPKGGMGDGIPVLPPWLWPWDLVICSNQPSHLGGSEVKICLQGRRPAFNPQVGKILWRRAWQPTPVFLPEESHGQRSLAGYSPWGRRSWTQLRDQSKPNRSGIRPSHLKTHS